MSGDSYHEERDALDGDVDEEESHGAHVVVDIEERPDDVFNFHFLIFVGSALQLKPQCGDSALAFVEEPAFGGVRRHKEGSTEADDYGEEALEEEYVAPGVDDHR